MGFLDNFAKAIKHPFRVPHIKFPHHLLTSTIKKFSHNFNTAIEPISRLEHKFEQKLIPFHNVIDIAGRKIKNKFHPRKSRDRRNLNIIDNNNPIKNKNMHIAGKEMTTNLNNLDGRNLNGHEYNMLKNPKIYIFGTIIIVGGIYLIKK